MAEGYQLKMMAGVSLEIGNEQNNIEYLNKAVEYGDKAVEIAQEIDDKILEGSVLGILGHIYMARKDMHSASSIVGSRDKPMLHLDSDGIHKLLGDQMLASQHFEKSAAILHEAADFAGSSSALYLFAVSLQKMGQYDQALTVAYEAYQIMAEIGSPMLHHVKNLISQLQQES